MIQLMGLEDNPLKQSASWLISNGDLLEVDWISKNI